MKKKLLVLAMTACVAFGLAGCSGKLSDDYVTINKYKGLEVDEVAKTEVTDDMVESSIDTKLEENGNTEGEVKDGDTVNLDFTGSVDGVEFDGGQANGASLEIGSGTFIGANGDYKGFEEQLVGHKVGEEFTITVKFPDDYSSTELAGKVADFKIKINSIKAELTDDWVKANSDKSKTVAEYKKEVKKELEAKAEETQNYSLRSEVLTALIDQVELTDKASSLVEDKEKEIKEYYQSQATTYGVEFSEFLSSYLNMTEEEFDAQVKTVAENTIKQEKAVELLADKKKLEPTDKEYEEAYQQYADDYGYESVDKMKELVGEDTLKQLVRKDAVGDYLVKSCVQVEASDTSSTSDSSSK
jgi:trigger factor